MQKVFLGARIILGLIFVVFGLNFFLHFIPMPPPGPQEAQEYLGALFKTGFIFPIIKVLEVVFGLALLFGIFVPLALVILAPIVVNIALVHFILDRSGAGMAALLIVLMLLVAWSYRSDFAVLFKAK